MSPRPELPATAGVRPPPWAAFLALVLLAWPGSLHAVTARSRSGQFVIHSPYATTPTLSQWTEPTNSTRITLSPDPLAVSCDRIKTAVLRQLDLPDRWRGKIQISIRPTLRGGVQPALVSTRFADGWHYAIELPERCDPNVLVRLVVQALLTEFANRHRGTHPAELPLWLVEGLSARVQGTAGPDLVAVPTPLLARTSAAGGQLDSAPRERVGAENLPEIRAWLFGRTPLSFTDLSQPGAEFGTADGERTYRLCAELFLYHLQGLADGRRCLQAMLANLTQALNWQTAFLHAFAPHFDRLLDVEKWWTVVLHHFLRGDQPNSWPRATSLDKLTELVQVRVEIQNRPNGPRRPSTIPLQEFLAQADLASQRELLRSRMQQLKALERTASLDTVPLIRSYGAVLEDYLSKRVRAGYAPPAKRMPELAPALLLRDVTARLAALDQRRVRLRSIATTPETASQH